MTIEECKTDIENELAIGSYSVEDFLANVELQNKIFQIIKEYRATLNKEEFDGVIKMMKEPFSSKEEEPNVAIILDRETKRPSNEKNIDTDMKTDIIEIVTNNTESAKNFKDRQTEFIQFQKSAIREGQTDQLIAQPKPFSVFDPMVFQKLLDNAEIMTTPRHLSVFPRTETIKKADGSEQKITREIYWLNIRYVRDVLCTAMNISVEVSTKIVTVPLLNDVLFVAICNIYDCNRNILILGESAYEYIYRSRPNKSGDGIKRDFGDENVFETCISRSYRRAIENLVPQYIIDKIVEIAKRKIKEENDLRKKSITPSK